MSNELSRRKFLTYVGTGVTALTVTSAGLGAMAPSAEAQGAKAASHLFGFKKRVSGLKFKPIEPSAKDELVLPKGYKYDVVAAYGDVINKEGDTFGFNNDFTMYFPIDGSNRGLLWVNHEYSSDLFVHGNPDQMVSIQRIKLRKCCILKAALSLKCIVMKRVCGRWILPLNMHVELPG